MFLSQMISGDFIQISSYNNEHGIGRCHGRSRFPFKNWPFSGQGVIVLLSTIASSLFFILMQLVYMCTCVVR